MRNICLTDNQKKSYHTQWRAYYYTKENIKNVQLVQCRQHTTNMFLVLRTQPQIRTVFSIHFIVSCQLLQCLCFHNLTCIQYILHYPIPVSQGQVTYNMHILFLKANNIGQEHNFTRIYLILSRFHEYPIFIWNKFLSSCSRFF